MNADVESCPNGLGRPADHDGPIALSPEWEPIDHGLGLWFKCQSCGMEWCGAIDFDEMEVAN